jgi:hypothetical protein
MAKTHGQINAHDQAKGRLPHLRRIERAMGSEHKACSGPEDHWEVIYG